MAGIQHADIDHSGLTGVGGASFVGAQAYNAGSQSIPDITVTALTFPSEDFDTDGFHSTSSNTSRMTIPTGKGGKYLIRAYTRHAANNTNDKILFLRLNGADVDRASVSSFPNASLEARLELTKIMDLAVGDYVEACIYQASGGALNFGVNGGSELSVVFLG